MLGPATPRARSPRRAFTLLEVAIAIALLAALTAAALPPLLDLARQRAAEETAAQIEAATIHARLDAQRAGRPMLLVVRERADTRQQLVLIPLDADADEDRAAPDPDAARDQPGRVLLTLPRDVFIHPADQSADPFTPNARDNADPRATLLGEPAPTDNARPVATDFVRQPLPAGGISIALIMPDGALRALTSAEARAPGDRRARVEVVPYPGIVRLRWLDASDAPPEPTPPTLQPSTVDDPRFDAFDDDWDLQPFDDPFFPAPGRGGAP